MSEARKRTMRVITCVLSLLLVAGLVPLLPEHPRALADEAPDSVALGDGAAEGEVAVLGGTGDGAAGPGDSGQDGADDREPITVQDEEAVGEPADRSGIEVQEELAASDGVQEAEPVSDENDLSEGGTVLETKSLNVFNSRVVLQDGIVVQNSNTSGVWGSCAWAIDANGKLTIHAGHGADMVGEFKQFVGKVGYTMEFDGQPWYEVRDDIKSVVFERGVILPEDCSGLFCGCHQLTAIDISGCDSTNTKVMRRMFSCCPLLETITLGGFNTSSATDMSYMFAADAKLHLGDEVERFNTSSATNMKGMFSSVTFDDRDLNLTEWDVSRVTDMSSLFSSVTARSVDISGWHTSAVENVGNMFYWSKIDNVIANSLDFSSCKSLESMFINSKCRVIDLSMCNVSKVTSLLSVFIACGGLEEVDLSGWDTSSVQDMGFMFANCGKLKSINVADWDVKSVKDFYGMFDSCYSLVDLDLSAWNTSSAEDFGYMFRGCQSIVSLDLSGWNTAHVTKTATGYVEGKGNSGFRGMFAGCTSLDTLDIANWDTMAVASARDMFKDCNSITSISIGVNYRLSDGGDYPMFPNSSATGGMWWSAKAKAWYTIDDIVKYRSGVADTYTTSESRLLSSCTVTISPTSYTYDGTAKTPTVTVKDGSTTLASGTDYSVAYSNNTNAGTGNVTITGANSYTGTVAKTFTINPKPLSSCTMALSPSSYTYDGTQKNPTVAVKDGSKTMVSGTDYALTTPSGRIDAGTYTYTATGRDNYTGTETVSFTIAQANPALRFASASVIKKTTDAAFTNALTKTTDGSVSFKSSNIGVATVSSATGLVTIKGAGTTTITASAAAGTNYKAGSASYTLTAVKPLTYSISYDANGGTGTPSAQTKEEHVPLVLSDIRPAKAYVLRYNAAGGSVSPASKSLSCTFKSWNTARGGDGTSYSPGAAYVENANATLYAQWESPKAGSLVTPSRSGYAFAGWYTSASGGSKVTSSTLVSGDMTIYAHWTDPYNMGDETYSFSNYVDSDFRGGHCFGMSITSAGYHNNLIDITRIGGDASTPLYSFDDTQVVRRPICYYQGVQGSYSKRSTVAGGSYYLGRGYDIASDWKAVVDYVKDHGYDSGGLLQIGYRGVDNDGDEGGHAVNFLRYEKVGGQDRIYAYDNNCPSRETYFYKDSYGRVLQTPYESFDGALKCIALRDVRTYFGLAGDFDATHVVYVAEDAATIQGLGFSYMESGQAETEYVMYEIPASKDKVTIVPSKDYADFIYMGTEYSFGEVTGSTRGELKLATLDEGAVGSDVTFTIYEDGARIPSVALSKDSFGYDGSVHKPKVTVKVDGTVLKASRDYTVEWPSGMVDVGTYELKVTLRGEYSGEVVKAFAITKGKQVVTAANKSVQVGKTASLGAKTSGDGKLTYKSSDKSVATVSSKGVVTGRKVGTAKVTITAAATANYAKATKTVTVTVKNANTMAAKAKKATVAASLKALKTKAVTLDSNVTVSKAKGAVSYANASGNATAKRFKVDEKTGKLTVPKGTKKGKYQVKIKATAKGNGTYLSVTKTVSFCIQVK